MPKIDARLVGMHTERTGSNVTQAWNSRREFVNIYVYFSQSILIMMAFVDGKVASITIHLLKSSFPHKLEENGFTDVAVLHRDNDKSPRASLAQCENSVHESWSGIWIVGTIGHDNEVKIITQIGCRRFLEPVKDPCSHT